MKLSKHSIILLVFFVVFLLIYNFTNIFIWWPKLIDTGHLIFNWPDANANYFFAKIFSHSNYLAYYEPLNLLTDNLLHTRSINVIDGNLVPITFLPAIVLFGTAWRILGDFGILAFSPFLAALSGLLVYRLMYYIFKDLDLSLISALLFWSLAPWVFFSNVVMLPNILFIFLSLAGFWSLAKSIVKDKSLYWILSSLFLSLAIFVRPTEIVWLALIIIFVVYINRHKFHYKNYIYSSLIFLGTAFLFLSLNKSTYGAYLSLGYFNFQEDSLASEFNTQQTSNLLDYIKLLLFPFGFDLILILKNIYYYFIKIFTPHLLLALIALVMMVYRKQISYPWKKYLLLTPFIFLLIFIYYASWDLADPLVKELNKISISYVRYFLPLFILTIPLTALGVKQIFFGPTKINKLSYYIVLIALILSSIKLAFYSEHDGLLANKDTLNNYYIQYQLISEQVEDNAVIISERSDKIFFPKYRVITYNNNPDLWSRTAKILDKTPIYYYTDQSIDVDQKTLDKLNLKLENHGQIWHDFSLYKLIR